MLMRYLKNIEKIKRKTRLKGIIAFLSNKNVKIWQILFINHTKPGSLHNVIMGKNISTLSCVTGFGQCPPYNLIVGSTYALIVADFYVTSHLCDVGKADQARSASLGLIYPCYHIVQQRFSSVFPSIKLS